MWADSVSGKVLPRRETHMSTSECLTIRCVSGCAEYLKILSHEREHFSRTIETFSVKWAIRDCNEKYDINI